VEGVAEAVCWRGAGSAAQQEAAGLQQLAEGVPAARAEVSGRLPAPGAIRWSAPPAAHEYISRMGHPHTQVLRAPYLDGAFLAQAQQRYLRYMQLATAAAGDNPGLLAPTVDVCHMWRTHVSISGAYKQDSLAALHQLYEPASLVPQLW
jgi:hypothetical protein